MIENKERIKVRFTETRPPRKDSWTNVFSNPTGLVFNRQVVSDLNLTQDLSKRELKYSKRNAT